ncbi:MAG TPA: trigger factor [Clostridiales bacterium]|jgi:trigger factor|nr:trigger factor [Clostridiales bacterium]
MTPDLVQKEGNEATFTMAFTAEDFEEALQKAYKAQRGKFAIDGFRKGKAPRTIIEARYGKDIFFEDAIDELFRTGYPEAIEALNLKPVDRPSVDFGEEPLEAGQAFSVNVSVTVTPEVTVKDYKGVEAVKVIHKAKEEDVAIELEALQKRNSRLVVVERKAEDGDTVKLDYAGFVGEDQFEGGTAENQTLVLGSGSFIPGFEEQLIGAEAGDEVDVSVTFPEDYHSEDLAGKEAIFRCKIHDVRMQELPELDDEFAKDVSEFDTLEELKNDIRTKQETHAADVSEFETKNAVMEKVYDANEVDLPKVMIEDQADQMLQEFAQQLSYQGMNLDMYCQYLQKTQDEIRDELMPDAEKRVKSRLIIEAVADAEDIQAAPEDIENELAAMAKQYNMETDKLKELFGDENMDYLIQDIRMRKAIDFIYENAKLSEPEEGAEESDSNE